MQYSLNSAEVFTKTFNMKMFRLTMYMNGWDVGLWPNTQTDEEQKLKG